MASKKVTDKKDLKIKGTNIKVSKKQVSKVKKSIEKSVKKAVKHAPKKYRFVYSIAGFAFLALLTFFVDRFVEPIKYLTTNLNKFTIAPLGENELRLHFIDVGQGDSMILEFPDSTNMIIDGGDKKTSTYTKVIRYAKSLKIKVFDYMLLTHTDADHLGGLDDVAEVFEIKKVFMPYIEKGLFVSNAYDKFLKVVEKKATEIDISNYGDSIVSTDNKNMFIMSFLSPMSHLDGENIANTGEYAELNEKLRATSSENSKQKNDVSPLTIIDYLGVKIFLSGDANIPVEERAVDRILDMNYFIQQNNDTSISPFILNGNNYVVDLDVDLIKAGHHGSKDSSGQKLLDNLKPEHAVISVGASNNYGHPHIELLDRLKGFMEYSNIYRTDLHGDIIATIKPQASGEKGKLIITTTNNSLAESENSTFIFTTNTASTGKIYLMFNARRSVFTTSIIKITG